LKMRKFRIVVTSLLVYIIFSGIACRAEEIPTPKSIALPANMKGAWQVSDVLFDQGDNEVVHKGLDKKYFIPRYLGRIINITSKKITINSPIESVCEDPKLLPRKSTAAKIVAKSIHTRIYENSYPTPHDMRLPLADDTPVEVLYLTCGDKFRSSQRGFKVLHDLSNARWFINLGNDRLAMNWRSQSILILSRLRNNAKPVASFDCAKAGTIAEKTICSDVGLAAYDKSLAQAYNLVMAYYRSRPDTKSTIAELRAFQKKWIAKRDRCGNDIACLGKTIDDRIVDLVYDLIDFWYDNPVNQ
jgi:uncharacterized protein YecT (DUF1311 family)